MSESFHGKNFRLHSTLVPSKLSIANITRNFPLYWCFTMDIPKNQLREKFRHILGKIPKNFSKLTLRIFFFIGDESSEELT
jgi:hypothetical protein